MRLLFDEMMPEELGDLLVGHEVSHVIELGWRHLTNGQLLAMGESQGFAAFITKDGNLPYQQNMVGRRIAVIVLRPDAQSLPALLLLAPTLLRELRNLQPGSVSVVTPE